MFSNIWQWNFFYFSPILPFLGVFFGIPFKIFQNIFYYFRMIICECVEPQLIVNAFGSVTTYSVIFNIGVQIALYNFLSDIGIPFYRQVFTLRLFVIVICKMYFKIKVFCHWLLIGLPIKQHAWGPPQNHS